MRVLYFDIDSLRPDHLGCYGYHRATSPNIDRIAREGVRFARCYASDVPCLPSRSALFSGRFGIHNGVINHGGVAAEPRSEGPERGFRSTWAQTNWMITLRALGYRTASISSFAERHAAFHFYAGFSEIRSPGKNGLERADEVAPLALDWLERNGSADRWFLHVNLWDPHTPYRYPDSFGNVFASDPLPAWYSEGTRQAHWEGCGPHSAREVMGFGNSWEWEYANTWPKQPVVLDSMDKVRMIFDGYDCGTRFADEHIGQILNKLADLNILDETAVIISADHGENLGELNIYGDHQTADEFTSHIPLIVRIPGLAGERVDNGLIYNIDFAATLIELLGGNVPDNWDGRSFAEALRRGESRGRDYLVLSQGAWSCQRSVRFEDWLFIKSIHDGYHAFPDEMLFNLANDPHEQQDVARSKPEVTAHATELLFDWHEQMMSALPKNAVDPMDTVMAEGGPFHARGQLPAYLERLRNTGRTRWAEVLAARHPAEARAGADPA